MEFNYLYGKQAEQFAYVNIPKTLIHEEAFSDVSLEAKMLYGLIMERMGMYRKNKWQDEQGRVYMLYPVKAIYGMMIDRVSLSIKNGWLDEDGKTYIHYSVADIMAIPAVARIRF